MYMIGLKNLKYYIDTHERDWYTKLEKVEDLFENSSGVLWIERVL